MASGLALALLAMVMLSLWPVSDFASRAQHGPDMAASAIVGDGSGGGDLAASVPECETDAGCVQAIAGVMRAGFSIAHDPDSHAFPDLSTADIWAADAREPVPIG